MLFDNKKDEINPTIRHANICDMYIKIPSCALPKITPPIPLIKKAGPQFTQYDSKILAFWGDKYFAFTEFASNLAPTGYPPIKLSINIAVSNELILNNLLVMKLKGTDMMFLRLLASIKFDITMNINILGITKFKEMSIPLRTPAIISTP